jgi:hypothetical protein
MLHPSLLNKDKNNKSNNYALMLKVVHTQWNASINEIKGGLFAPDFCVCLHTTEPDWTIMIG